MPDPLLKCTLLTTKPEMFPGPLAHGLCGKALQQGLWKLDTVDITTQASPTWHGVDSTPAGGGPGMVMRADVLDKALKKATQHTTKTPPLLYLTPRGLPLQQKHMLDLASSQEMIVICGRFEGIDQRFIDARGVREVSIGDYILSSGDMAAMVMLDAIVRLLPGVVGHPDSLKEESFAQGLLEHHHYTKPQKWENQEIPAVLLSGNHRNIQQWRQQQSEKLTQTRRPDLWKKYKNV